MQSQIPVVQSVVYRDIAPRKTQLEEGLGEKGSTFENMWFWNWQFGVIIAGVDQITIMEVLLFGGNTAVC